MNDPGPASYAHVRFPDGLARKNIERRGRGFGHASPVALFIIGIVLALALGGLFGGRFAEPLRLETAEADFTLDMPRTLRNGVLLEARMSLEANQDLSDATIALEPGLFQDITINTNIPSASEETFGPGGFRLAYGPLKAGERLLVKIDGQINPSLIGVNRGDITLYDGDRRLGALPVTIRVLP